MVDGVKLTSSAGGGGVELTSYSPHAVPGQSVGLSSSSPQVGLSSSVTPPLRKSFDEENDIDQAKLVMVALSCLFPSDRYPHPPEDENLSPENFLDRLEEWLTGKKWQLSEEVVATGGRASEVNYTIPHRLPNSWPHNAMTAALEKVREAQQKKQGKTQEPDYYWPCLQLLPFSGAPYGKKWDTRDHFLAINTLLTLQAATSKEHVDVKLLPYSATKFPLDVLSLTLASEINRLLSKWSIPESEHIKDPTTGFLSHLRHLRVTLEANQNKDSCNLAGYLGGLLYPCKQSEQPHWDDVCSALALLAELNRRSPNHKKINDHINNQPRNPIDIYHRPRQQHSQDDLDVLVGAIRTDFKGLTAKKHGFGGMSVTTTKTEKDKNGKPTITEHVSNVRADGRGKLTANQGPNEEGQPSLDLKEQLKNNILALMLYKTHGGTLPIPKDVHITVEPGLANGSLIEEAAKDALQQMLQQGKKQDITLVVNEKYSYTLNVQGNKKPTGSAELSSTPGKLQKPNTSLWTEKKTKGNGTATQEGTKNRSQSF